MKHYLPLADGSQLFYQTIGAGRPLVLLHGNGQSHVYFMRQTRVLSRYFKLYLVDLRDHGRSKNTQSTLTFDMITADLYALFQYEQLKEAAIIGFSDGANSALSFVNQYPDCVTDLVLISPNNHRKGIIKEQVKKTQRLINGCRRLKLKKQERILRLGIESLALTNEALAQIKQRVLMIQGEWDIIKAAHLKELVEQIPDCRFILAKKSAHSVPFFKAHWFNQTVLDFLLRKAAPL